MIALLILLSLLAALFILFLGKRTQGEAKEIHAEKPRALCEGKTATVGTVKQSVVRDKQKLTEIAGNFTWKQFSPNREYCVVTLIGVPRERGSVALVRGEALLFKCPVTRPNDCHVSDTGITICCDRTNSQKASCIFLVFDPSGATIFLKKVPSDIGVTAISADGKYALFEAYGSDITDGPKIYIIGIEQRKVISKFKKPIGSHFYKAKFLEKNKTINFFTKKGIIYQTDFSGIHTNANEFKDQILKRGAIIDKVSFYEENQTASPEETELFIRILNKALKDPDCSHVFGLDGIYRKIGEHYEALGQLRSAVEQWEKALELNPKVGLKRKLEQIRNKLNAEGNVSKP